MDLEACVYRDADTIRRFIRDDRGLGLAGVDADKFVRTALKRAADAFAEDDTEGLFRAYFDKMISGVPANKEAYVRFTGDPYALIKASLIAYAKEKANPKEEEEHSDGKEEEAVEPEALPPELLVVVGSPEPHHRQQIPKEVCENVTRPLSDENDVVQLGDCESRVEVSGGDAELESAVRKQQLKEELERMDAMDAYKRAKLADGVIAAIEGYTKQLEQKITEQKQEEEKTEETRIQAELPRLTAAAPSLALSATPALVSPPPPPPALVKMKTFAATVAVAPPPPPALVKTKKFAATVAVAPPPASILIGDLPPPPSSRSSRQRTFTAAEPVSLVVGKDALPLRPQTSLPTPPLLSAAPPDLVKPVVKQTRREAIKTSTVRDIAVAPALVRYKAAAPTTRAPSPPSLSPSDPPPPVVVPAMVEPVPVVKQVAEEPELAPVAVAPVAAPPAVAPVAVSTPPVPVEPEPTTVQVAAPVVPDPRPKPSMKSRVAQSLDDIINDAIKLLGGSGSGPKSSSLPPLPMVSAEVGNGDSDSSSSSSESEQESDDESEQASSQSSESSRSSQEEEDEEEEEDEHERRHSQSHRRRSKTATDSSHKKRTQHRRARKKRHQKPSGLVYERHPMTGAEPQMPLSLWDKMEAMEREKNRVAQ